MANPLYNQLGNVAPANDGGLSQFINQVQEMTRSFNGNPRAEVERLLNSGQMSQQQFNQFAQMANQIRALMPKH